jgi:gas vesicle protein
MHLQSFIRGVSVGFILGVLFAPDSGVETRRKISKRATDIKDTVKDTYDEISGTVSDQIGRVKNKASQIMHKGQKSYDELKDQTGNI